MSFTKHEEKLGCKVEDCGKERDVGRGARLSGGVPGGGQRVGERATTASIPLVGDAGDNTLIGTDCDQRIRGYAGNDLIRGGGGNDIIEGGAGEDQIFGDEGDDIVNAGNDDDWIDGGPGDDELTGGGGDDHFLGGDGNDHLKGGSDDDHLDGGAGVDVLEGGAADDYLDDAEGANTLDGGIRAGHHRGPHRRAVCCGAATSDDFLIIVGQANSIAGYELVEGDVKNQANGGSDLLFFARDANPEMVSEVSGELLLSFDLRTQDPVNIDLADVLHVEAVATGDGADRVIGTDSTFVAYRGRLGPLGLYVHELFFTAAGDDVIETGEGDDFVDAGPGNDTVRLGTGKCYLIGGEGDDTFIWSEAALAGNKVSRITDLDTGDVVRWQGSWQIEDVTLDAVQEDGEAATSVRLEGVHKLTLDGVEPSDVRLRQARDGVWIDVLRSLPRQRSKSKGAAALFGG